jgi:hypothetical protein
LNPSPEAELVELEMEEADEVDEGVEELPVEEGGLMEEEAEVPEADSATLCPRPPMAPSVVTTAEKG